MEKTFEKQTETIKDQGEKQVEVLNTLKSENKKLAIEDIIPKSAYNNYEAKEEINKITEIEKTIDREKIVYKASEYTCGFRNFRTIRTFGRDIYNGEITLKEADEDQLKLVDGIEIFNNKTRPQSANKKQEKEIVLENLYKFYDAKKKFLMDLTA